MLKTAYLIEKGANTFLFEEYKYMAVFVGILALIIFFAVEERMWTAWTTAAFLTGSATSVISGFLGMKVAVFSNYRTTYSANTGIPKAFTVAFRAGAVMGFGLSSLGILVLTTLIVIYQNTYIH